MDCPFKTPVILGNRSYSLKKLVPCHSLWDRELRIHLCCGLILEPGSSVLFVMPAMLNKLIWQNSHLPWEDITVR